MNLYIARQAMTSLLILSLAGQALAAPPPAVRPQKEATQIIQVGDLLFLAVSPAEEMSRDLQVDANGRISIPLLGAIDAAGRTVEELARHLTGRLAQYVTNPKVDIYIKQSAGKVAVLGQVASPGSFAYRPQLRLMDLVSMAGGFTANADKRHVRLLRGKGASSQVTLVNAEEIVAAGDISRDVVLKPGDLVEVPRGTMGITIFGEVEKAGSYDYIHDMRLLDIVSLCQGFDNGANLNRITIYRGEMSDRKVIRVRFADVLKNRKGANLALRPGDIIHVPQRSIWSASAFASALTPISTLVMAAATVVLAVRD